MSSISTHVLNLAHGRPADDITAILEYSRGENDWHEVSRGVTNSDGRIPALVPKEKELSPGIYRLTFDTGAFFEGINMDAFYPYVQIVFEVRDPNQHYHVPLLLSPFGYSTYRGS